MTENQLVTDKHTDRHRTALSIASNADFEWACGCSEDRCNSCGDDRPVCTLLNIVKIDNGSYSEIAASHSEISRLATSRRSQKDFVCELTHKRTYTYYYYGRPSS